MRLRIPGEAELFGRVEECAHVVSRDTGRERDALEVAGSVHGSQDAPLALAHDHLSIRAPVDEHDAPLIPDEVSAGPNVIAQPRTGHTSRFRILFVRQQRNISAFGQLIRVFRNIT